MLSKESLEDVNPIDIVNAHGTNIQVKQQSEMWFKIRKLARVTGSRIYTALGLESKSKQKDYFEEVVQNKTTPKVPPNAAMLHGLVNEKNALGVLVSRVLPAYYPNIDYVEEGCRVLKNDNQIFGVVSPDGRGEDSSNNAPVLAFEFKCPFPDKQYTTDVHYEIPDRYIPQILAEMATVEVNELLYLCYTPKSSTVFKVCNNRELWDEMLALLKEFYGGEKPQRPNQTAGDIKMLRHKIKIFKSECCHLVVELGSTKTIECNHRDDDTMDGTYGFHGREADGGSFSLIELEQTMYSVRSSLNEAYDVSRLIAKEVLVAVISDLDRSQTKDGPHAVPIAYGLSGYSLKCESVRGIILDILQSCDNKGLHVPAISFDGQFYNIAVRSNDNQPLTILQLAKDIWERSKKMSKAEQQRTVANANLVGRTSDLQSLSAKVDIDVDVRNAMYVSPITVGPVKSTIASKILTPANLNKHLNKAPVSNPVSTETEAEDHVFHLIPTEIQQTLDYDTVQRISQVNQRLADCSQVTGQAKTTNRDFIGAVQDLDNLTAIADAQSDTSNHTVNDANRVQQVADITNRPTSMPHNVTVLNQMLDILHNNQNEQIKQKWRDINADALLEKFSSASVIAKSFTVPELRICFSVLNENQKNGRKTNTNCPKHKADFVNLFSNAFGDGSTIQSKVSRKVASLRQLSKDAVNRLPKNALNIIMATNLFPHELQKWRSGAPFQDGINVEGEPYIWYSQPEYYKEIDAHVATLLDCHHIFVNCRSLICRKGLPSQRISAKAWHSVALNARENKTGLSPAIAIDIIDRQSNALAQKVFSPEVEREMRQLGYEEEARFCADIRNWYRAEDEPGLSASERHSYRIKLRNRLLQCIKLNQFPPSGSHVADMPVVMFEGILTNIDRRTQLYAMSKSGTYNVRAPTSLDSETTFSAFQDLDPRGSGILHPDDVPRTLAAATFLFKSKNVAER